MNSRITPTGLVHALVLAAHLALIILLLVDGSRLSLLAALLLFLPLPGLLKGRAYTHAWASMMLAIYCAALLADGYARPATQHHAFLLAGLAALEFVCLMMYVRFSARESLVRKAGSNAASG